MLNFSEGIRSLCAYTTFGLLAVSAGWIWTAHNDLNAQKEAAMAAIQDLFLAVQDEKLELAELNLTKRIEAQPDSFSLPGQQGGDPLTALPQRLVNAIDALRSAQAALALDNYWLVDDQVRRGFAELGVSLPVPDIEEIVLDDPLGIKMPENAKVAGSLAALSALLTIGAGLDTDGKGSRFFAWLKSRRGGGP